MDACRSSSAGGCIRPWHPQPATLIRGPGLPFISMVPASAAHAEPRAT